MCEERKFMMPETTHYDVLIIGSGQSGGPLATAFAHNGYKTAIIEREHIGGTCINEGVPQSSVGQDKSHNAAWCLTSRRLH